MTAERPLEVADVAAAVASCPDRTVPRLRGVRRELSRALEPRTGSDVRALARALIETRTTPRWFAYELIHHHRDAMAGLEAASLEELGRGMESWGEVDPFAVYLSGVSWREGRISARDVRRWARRDDRWWRRAAIVSTVPLNSKSRGGAGDVERTLAMCHLLRTDRDDMVVKGLSWALRELAKREPRAVRAWVSKHETELARRVIREVRNTLDAGRKDPGRGRGRGCSLRSVLALLAASIIGAGCGDDAPGPSAPEETCGPFPDWSTSPYDLPYPAGKSYELRQANCSGFGHVGFWKHGYDFIMPIGTIVIASRSGTVGWAKDGCTDGDMTCTNLITVIHDDGTVAVYSHLTLGGVLVESGQAVSRGDTIALSGNTGYSTEPHLHFSLHPCNELPGLPNPGYCPSLPFTVRNTDPNPEGLMAGRFYEAR